MKKFVETSGGNTMVEHNDGDWYSVQEVDASIARYKELLRKAALTLNNRRAFDDAAEIYKALEE